MICLQIFILGQVLLLASGCPDSFSTVHIQNHDGPIYVNHDKFPCDHHLTIGNQDTDCCNTCGGSLPNNPSTCSCNQPTYSGNLPTYTCGNQSPMLHCSPVCPVYEHECKCTSKTMNPVPINTVSQSGCYGYGQPGCSYVYPDYSAYGYYYPECYGSGETCPNVSQGLIPLLKSYLGQKSKAQCCQCGKSCSS